MVRKQDIARPHSIPTIPFTHYRIPVVKEALPHQLFGCLLTRLRRLLWHTIPEIA